MVKKKTGTTKTSDSPKERILQYLSDGDARTYTDVRTNCGIGSRAHDVLSSMVEDGTIKIDQRRGVRYRLKRDYPARTWLTPQEGADVVTSAILTLTSTLAKLERAREVLQQAADEGRAYVPEVARRRLADDMPDVFAAIDKTKRDVAKYAEAIPSPLHLVS